MGEMKLKACPFCGGGSIIRTESAVHDTVTVMCTYCFAQIEISAGADVLAIDRWQNRPIEDALLARAEKAEAMVERLIEVGFDFFHGNPYTIHEKHYDELVAEWERRNDKQEE